MKLKDIEPGMAVYYAGRNSSSRYSLDRFYDDPDDCRWVVADDKRYRRYGSGWRPQVTDDPKGNLVKITRTVEADPEADEGTRAHAGYTDTEYVTLAKLLGPYEETAAERRRLKAEHVAAEDRARELRQNARQNARNRRAEVVEQAKAAGFEMYATYDSGNLEIGVEELARLLDALDTAYRRGVEAGQMGAGA